MSDFGLTQDTQDSKPLIQHTCQLHTITFPAQFINVINQCHPINPFHLDEWKDLFLYLALYTLLDSNAPLVIFEFSSDTRGMHGKVGAKALVAKLRIRFHLYQEAAQRSHFATMGAKFVDHGKSTLDPPRSWHRSNGGLPGQHLHCAAFEIIILHTQTGTG